MLTERGHDVHLVYSTLKTEESQEALERFAEGDPRLTISRLPRPARTPLASLSEDLRRSADHLLYLDPVYAGAPKLRERRARRAPAAAQRLGHIARPLGPGVLRMLRGALRAFDRTLEPPSVLEDILRAQVPDVVLTTTLVSVGLPHADLVRAAKRLRIPTGYLVFSWDNLTNKGLIREIPDQVLVWNDLQAREAVELHDVPESRVRVTGAPSYDHWFTWAPSRSRDEFAHLVGLDPDRPIVLYVCSTHFVAPNEAVFVRRWIRALREHGGPTAEVGILVRPHPLNIREWRDTRLDLPDVVVWPPHGQEPIDRESRQNYFDSIYHADAVVGINTSAQIEAAIVGRPVHTVLADEYRETQDGTLHFRYLHDEAFGHLHVARTLDEHVALLGSSIRGETDPERNERFVRRFLRPLGLDVAATAVVVEAIEELEGRRPVAGRRGMLAPAVDRGAHYLAAISWRRRRSTRRRLKERPRPPRPIEAGGGMAPPR